MRKPFKITYGHFLEQFKDNEKSVEIKYYTLDNKSVYEYDEKAEDTYGIGVADCFTKSNARRIMNCLNYCNNLSNEELEAKVIKEKMLLHHLKELLKAGEHEGKCDNENEDGTRKDGACMKHVNKTNERRSLAEQYIKSIS